MSDRDHIRTVLRSLATGVETMGSPAELAASGLIKLVADLLQHHSEAEVKAMLEGMLAHPPKLADLDPMEESLARAKGEGGDES